MADRLKIAARIRRAGWEREAVKLAAACVLSATGFMPAAANPGATHGMVVTAQHLASDVGRFIQGEPDSARPLAAIFLDIGAGI
jgi:hypothetical protein